MLLVDLTDGTQSDGPHWKPTVTGYEPDGAPCG
jgi:hypothetical protein